MNNTVEVRSSNVVLKMRFSMPNPPNYLKGQDRIDYLEERAWVSNDFIDYAGRQGKYADKETPHDDRFIITPERGTLLDYVSRQGTFSDKSKTKSGTAGTGVWGKSGELTGEELERVKNVFKNTGGNIWHGLISPTKELGDVKLDSKEKAIDFTKTCLTRFLSATHLNYDNIEWYAGWHDDSESGIKHIQFAFCEKEKHLNAKGQYSYTQKGMIKKSTLADALINFEEYFSGKANDVHIARDEFFSIFKKLSPEQVQKKVLNDLIGLAKVLPKVKGRAGYRRKEFEPYRGKIDEVATSLIKNIPELNKGYIELMSKVAEREERFNKTAEQFNNMQPSANAIEKLRNDVKERIGNSIIGFAMRVDYNERKKDFQAVRDKRLSLMATAREEKKLRDKHKNERKADNKRISRLFKMFYSSLNSKNYLNEFFRDMEKAKAENENSQNDGE